MGPNVTVPWSYLRPMLMSHCTPACCASRLAVATHQGELTARRLVITFVPTTGWKLEDSRRGGCGHSNTEREFPSDKVYRSDDRGIVGVECLSPHRLGFFSVHTVLDVRRGLTVPVCPRTWLARATDRGSVASIAPFARGI
jgi:hypothetical protein